MINGNYALQSTKNGLLVLSIGTAIFSYFELQYTYSPQFIKVLFALCMWFSIFTFPFYLLKRNDIDKKALKLLKCIGILAVIALLRSVFTDVANISGNKWLSLFGNDQFFFMLIVPLFMLIGTLEDSVKILYKYFYILLLIGVWGIIFGINILSKSIYIGIIFFPYVNKRYKMLILITVIMAILASFYQAETSRTMIVGLLLSIFAYIMVYKLHYHNLLKKYALCIILIPGIYCIMMLFIPEFSIIEIILDFISTQNVDSDMTTDTRSFLFWELASDMDANNSWIFGKGAYSQYYSLYFDEVGADSKYRIASEVTFLTLILRSGLLYVAIYYCLIGQVVWKALCYSNNHFIKMCAVMCATWCFITYFSYMNGFNFIYVAFFILLGCCSSTKWLNKSDAEITSIFKR